MMDGVTVAPQAIEVRAVKVARTTTRISSENNGKFLNMCGLRRCIFSLPRHSGPQSNFEQNFSRTFAGVLTLGKKYETQVG
jgi:hypothetical protein